MNETFESAVTYIESKRKKNHPLQQFRAWLDFYLPEHKNLKGIQIAGTNGKGSTITWLAVLLGEMGYSCGIFTSPHLISHLERIAIDQKPILREEWMQIYKKWSFLFEKESFTMFEIDLWMAIVYFLEKQPDFILMETGLGGQKDAVTALDYAACGITNIGMDHMEFLGSTRCEIAKEKAGIAKKGVPLLTAEQDPKCLGVIRQTAARQGAFFKEAGQWNLETEDLSSYQKENLRLALSILKELGCNPAMEQIAKAKKTFEWKGRMSVLRKDPLLLVDGAHNPDGIKALVQSCQDLKIEKIYFSVLKDKEAGEMIETLQLLCRDIALVRFDSYRLADLELLRSRYELQEISFDQMMEHLCHTQSNTLVCGSLYFVGDVLKEWENAETGRL